MTKELLKIFIEGAAQYFKHISASNVVVGTPFLVKDIDPVVYGYTGVIDVSGEMNGCVYFTASSALLEKLLSYMGEGNVMRDNIMDMVGEVANTLSGNARSQLGSDFEISVPTVVDGGLSHANFPDGARFYVIPVSWEDCEAAVITCFKGDDSV